MLKDNTIGKIIGRRAAKELRVDDIVNIGIGIPEMVSRYARKSGMLDMVTLTVESGGIGGFPVSGFCMERDPKYGGCCMEWHQGFLFQSVGWD